MLGPTKTDGGPKTGAFWDVKGSPRKAPPGFKRQPFRVLYHLDRLDTWPVHLAQSP